MKRTLRQMWHFWERTPPFLIAFFSPRGIWHPEGRSLIWGKLRRFIFTLYPPFAVALQKKYRMQGGCVSCGASCKLLFQCPHWDTNSRLCTVYEDRPNVCRYFPITPSDIRDRDITLKEKSCGYRFEKPSR